MAVNVPDHRGALERFLAKAAGQPALKINNLDRLTGGTMQQTWRMDVQWPGATACWVLRTNEAMGIDLNLEPVQEYEVIKAARAVGVKAPTPLWHCSDPAVLGQDFFIMEFLDGIVEPHKLFAAAAQEGWSRESIIEQMGEELGRMQAVRPGPGVLPFFKSPSGHVAIKAIARARAYLDSHELPHPAIEAGLRWLERNAPPLDDVVLCHGDFRTGNYMVKDGRLRGILDWGSAHWGDPHEDLGWICLRFFRFGNIHLEAGGMADREPLLRGYERTSGRRVDPEVMCYWDIMADIAWAMVSLQQAVRYTSGAVDSFELALVGLSTAETEMEALDRINRREGFRPA